MEPPKEYDFDPRNLPHDLHAAIGLVIANASQTESVLEMAIAGCCGVDIEYGAAITTHMTIPLKFSILRSVAEIKIDDLDDLDELDKLLADIDAAFAKRNTIAHCGWCRDPETGAVFMYKEMARTRLEAELIPVAIEDIKDNATLIYDAGIALMNFLIKRKLLAPTPPFRPRGHKSKSARKQRRDQG